MRIRIELFPCSEKSPKCSASHLIEATTAPAPISNTILPSIGAVVEAPSPVLLVDAWFSWGILKKMFVKKVVKVLALLIEFG